jgi:type I restriction enzyme S subunit
MNSVVETRVAAGKVGVALTHFNTQSVAKLPLPIPPLAEQHRIVIEVDRRLSIVDETDIVVNENLARAELLRNIILQEAFNGRLAVDKWHNLSNVIQPLNQYRISEFPVVSS